MCYSLIHVMGGSQGLLTFEEILLGISIYIVSSMALFSSVRATDAYRTAITAQFSHETSASH